MLTKLATPASTVIGTAFVPFGAMGCALAALDEPPPEPEPPEEPPFELE